MLFTNRNSASAEVLGFGWGLQGSAVLPLRRTVREVVSPFASSVCSGLVAES